MKVLFRVRVSPENLLDQNASHSIGLLGSWKDPGSNDLPKNDYSGIFKIFLARVEKCVTHAGFIFYMNILVDGFSKLG